MSFNRYHVMGIGRKLIICTALIGLLSNEAGSESLQISGKIAPTLTVAVRRNELFTSHLSMSQGREIEIAELIASYNLTGAYSLSISSIGNHKLYELSYGEKQFTPSAQATEVYVAQPSKIPQRELHPLKIILPKSKNVHNLSDTLILTIQVM